MIGRYPDLLWDERPARNKLAFLYPWILLLIPVFVILGRSGENLGWVGLIALSLGNAVIHYRTKRKFSKVSSIIPKTVLKTIGVNMLFAQTLHFCLAKRFSSSFFNTLTLIGRKDNIIEGKSYYLQERY